MPSLSQTISAGDFTICRADRWHGEGEWCGHAKLYFPVRGNGWICADGQQTVLAPRSLYLIPPWHEISFGTATSIDIYWLHFMPEAARLQRRLAGGNVTRFNRVFSARWEATCRLIRRFVQEKSMSDLCRIQAMLLEVVATAVEKVPEESPEEQAAFERIAPALELMEKAEGPIPTLTDMAQAAAFSPEHFHRLFRKAFHTTPLHFALRNRMNRAQQLLSERKLSVAEVARRCGYEDAFYFSKVFRRHFGINPKKVSQGHAVARMP